MIDSGRWIKPLSHTLFLSSQCYPELVNILTWTIQIGLLFPWCFSDLFSITAPSQPSFAQVTLWSHLCQDGHHILDCPTWEYRCPSRVEWLGVGNDPKRTRSGTWPTLRDLLHDFRCGKVLALQSWLAALSLPENSSQSCALPSVFQFEQDTLGGLGFLVRKRRSPAMRVVKEKTFSIVISVLTPDGLNNVT